MVISIITVVYNNENTIADAIESVLSQKGVNVEYIVIDGGSSDNTLSVIKSYEDRIDKIVSEPDNGIYDAMNKGVKAATGDIIGILNSDDVYESDLILADVMEKFQDPAVDCLYANLNYVQQLNTDKIVRHWKSGPQKSFRYGWHPPHPSFFVRREVYEKHGLYNTDLRIAADFEMMLRLLERHKCKTAYLDKVLVKMRMGGESNRSLKNMMRGFRDIRRAFELNKLRMPLLYPLFRYLPKVKEFIS